LKKWASTSLAIPCNSGYTTGSIENPTARDVTTEKDQEIGQKMRRPVVVLCNFVNFQGPGANNGPFARSTAGHLAYISL